MTEKKTTNSYAKPMYAAAGAGELAVEQLKKLPETATKLTSRVQTGLKKIDLTEVRDDLENLTDRVRAELNQLRTRITEARREGTAEVRGDASKIRLNAQSAVSELVDTAQKQLQAATKQAAEIYEDLAVRGVKVLGETRVRGTSTGKGDRHVVKVEASRPAAKSTRSVDRKPAPKSTNKSTGSSSGK
ncbi:MAG TPA: hypothetical protein VFZ32_00810 [Micromonosporaceae bacterium]